MSKFLTTMAVLATTLGASTAIAGGIYIKDNQGVVKDYLNGNQTYTSAEYKEVQTELDRTQTELDNALNQPNEHPMDAELKEMGILKFIFWDLCDVVPQAYIGNMYYSTDGSYEDSRQGLIEDLNNHWLYQQCLNSPERYNWLGWSLTPDGEPIDVSTLELKDGLLELYARYETAKTYDFYIQGSDAGELRSVRFFNNDDFYVPDISEYVPADCTFAGWSTNPEDINSIVEVNSSDWNDGQQFFAVFTNADGSTVKICSQVHFVVGSAYIPCPAAMRGSEVHLPELVSSELQLPEGYSLVGATTLHNSTEVEISNTFVLNDDINLYLILQAEDGTVVNSANLSVIDLHCDMIGYDPIDRVCVSEEDFREYLTNQINSISTQLSENNLCATAYQDSFGAVYTNVEDIPFNLGNYFSLYIVTEPVQG